MRGHSRCCDFVCSGNRTCSQVDRLIYRFKDTNCFNDMQSRKESAANVVSKSACIFNGDK